MDVVMDICSRMMDRDCLGCPYKDKVTRKMTCMEWADKNPVEAEEIGKRFIANGYCLYDRKNPPFVGQLEDGRYQQICDYCKHTVILGAREPFVDEYIGKRVYVCPVCHRISNLKKMKTASGERKVG